MAVFAHAISLLIAGLFLHAGLNKLRQDNQAYYRSVIEAYQVLPVAVIKLMPRSIGLVESIAAILILTPLYTAIGIKIAIVMLVLYLVIFANQLIQGKVDVDCGCVGPGWDTKISLSLLLRNTILIALGVFTLISGTSKFSTTWFLVLPTTVLLGLIYLSVEQLIMNQQRLKQL